MRSTVAVALSLAVLALPACATGTDGLDLSSDTPLGDSGVAPDAHHRDAGTTPPPPPPDQDSSTPPPPDVDASVPDLDSSTPPPDDASPPPPPPTDSGQPSGAFCDTSTSSKKTIYGAEYAAALTGNPVFCDMSTGSGCTSTDCCFIPSFGLPACVAK